MIVVIPVLVLAGYSILWAGARNYAGQKTSLGDAWSCPQPTPAGETPPPGGVTRTAAPNPAPAPQLQLQPVPQPQPAPELHEERILATPRPNPALDLEAQAEALLNEIKRGSVGLVEAMAGLARLTAAAVKGSTPQLRVILHRIADALRKQNAPVPPFPHQLGAGGGAYARESAGFGPPAAFTTPSITRRDLWASGNGGAIGPPGRSVTYSSRNRRR